VTTSTAPTTSAPAAPACALRVELAVELGKGPLDGAWWPRSQELQREVGDLVDHFPGGRIDHLVYSRPDWATVTSRVHTARGSIKVGSFPRDDTHVVLLNLASRRILRLLVVPPDTEAASAHLMMHRAAEPDNRADAAELLRVSARPSALPGDIWNDDGGNYWGGNPVAPSHR
jgi:hypothetical protein